MKTFRLTLNLAGYAILGILGCRYYMANTPDHQMIADLSIVAIIIGVNAITTSRQLTPTKMNISFSNWENFWSDFLAFVDAADYSPSCKMDNFYFFENHWMKQNSHIVLRKISDDKCELTYPQSLQALVGKKLGIYSKIPLLKNSQVS